MGRHIITPNWPAPTNIKAYTTLRTGGVSPAPYHSFNLAEHVGDDALNVAANRKILSDTLRLHSNPIWLEQTHSTIVIAASPDIQGKEADAAFTNEANRICVIMTADCLPILICNQSGSHVAAIHAGWRGLANGIIEKTLQAMQLPPQEILIWLGPAIGPNTFEVGAEVRERFITKYPEAANEFLASTNQKWLGNLYGLARLHFNKQGVTQIYGGDFCTFTDKDRFFSYRRDNGKTGRMASLIWLT